MCGIFGVICTSDPRAGSVPSSARSSARSRSSGDDRPDDDHQLARALAIALLTFSETRGREAVGLAIHDGERIEVLKQAGSVTDFLANPKLHALLDGALARHRAAGRTTALAIAGHSRLATN